MSSRDSHLSQVSLLNSCNLSQTVAGAYFEKVGIDGFKEHTQEITQYYKSQRDAIISALDEHMADLATWIVPEVCNCSLGLIFNVGRWYDYFQ